MRIGQLYRVGLLFSFFVILPGTLALAQTPAPAIPACNGDITIVRVSTIKPGMMAAFTKAQDAHKAWYQSHGLTKDVIYSAKILVQDPTTKAWKYSDTEVMTFHITSSPSAPAHDAAYDAFVKMYRDSSDIKSDSVVCMPKAK